MKVLIVVDMQNDFVDGVLGTPEAQAIVSNVAKKVEEYANNDDIVIYTKDTHYDNYLNTMEGKKLPVSHCIKGTYGWGISQAVDIMYDKAFVIDKPTFGYLHWGKTLDDIIVNIYEKYVAVDSIELVGLCTDICVISNAMILKAAYSETPIIVDASCCAGVTPEKHAAALEVMKSCQIDVIGE